MNTPSLRTFEPRHEHHLPHGGAYLCLSKTARAGAGSSEVPGRTLSLRLHTQVGCGSFMACGPAEHRGEAWLKKGLLSSK